MRGWEWKGSGFDAEGGGDLAEGGGLGVADLALGAAGLRLDGGLGDALADQQEPAGVLGDVVAGDAAGEQVDRGAALLEDVVVEAGAVVPGAEVVLLGQGLDDALGALDHLDLGGDERLDEWASDQEARGCGRGGDGGGEGDQRTLGGTARGLEEFGSGRLAAASGLEAI